MLVNRVAYDRFQMQLPSAEPGWEPLAERSVAHDVASWLWQFGRTPLIAVVAHDGKKPKWVSSRLSVDVSWRSGPASAVIIERESDLEAFLVEGAPHLHTDLLWPRRSPAKTIEALYSGKWADEVEGHATVSPSGAIEILQLEPTSL